jgi:hypothetical protein
MSLAALAERIRELEGKPAPAPAAADPRIDELVAFMERVKPMVEDYEKMAAVLKPPPPTEAPAQG